MDADIKTLLERLKEVGIATAECKNGDRVLAIRRDKLMALLKAMDDSGQDYVLALIKLAN